MNGINNIEVNDIEFADGSTISSASSLVQLDTNNNFIGNNTFNVNLPTSSVNPNLIDINDNTILNKHAGDKLYSATDQNDFPTAFERDGLTGEITLTTADTGIPLSGDTSITSITDAEISAIATNTADITTNSTAIATNTSAIGSLTTATDPCFTTASINGQDLTLTPISGTSTIITIPSGGGGGAEWFSGYDSSPYGFAFNNNLRFANSSANVSFVDNGSGTGQQDGAVFSVNSDTAGTWVIGFTGMNLFFNNTATFYLYDRGSIKGYIFNSQTFSTGWNNVNGIWTLNLTAGQKICIRTASNGSSNIQHQSTGFWGIRLG
jgi:hypothetical protein